MRLVPRLIPTVILVAGLSLTLRIGELWHDAGVAFAQAAPVGLSPAAAAPAATSPAEPARPAVAGPPQQRFSPAEVELLQELSKRRTELDQRAEDLDHRELLLKAAEQRVDEKIARLQKMQQKVDVSLSKLQADDDQRLASLVHIYELMKPKDAASIFEGMDMPELVQLLGRMKDLKTAPILAAMAPEKARAVTLALAQRKEMPDLKTN